MIKKETIDKIYDSIDIVDVIGDFVNLKKRGANYVALSPFVNEKTPSFYVNPVKGIFKCFSSGIGGDAIKFVMENEKLNYPEALRYLAKKYAIEIAEDADPEELQKQKEEQSIRESLFNVNEFAKKYFYNALHESPEGLSIALSYLKERGLSPQIISKFEIGYSPNSKRAFTDYAIENGYTAEVLIKAGLTKSNEDHSWMVDAFNGRIVFPIHNISGRVVGFSARILTNDKNTAKYLNTAETDVYNKSKILFGLHLAKKNIIQKDNCYLVEGQMDVVSMFEALLDNTVASSGTALTVDQVRQIKKFTPNITILYDGDPAGIKATDRAIEIILQEGMNVRIVHFPDGDDPDSFFKKNDLAFFTEFVTKHANDFIQYKYELHETQIKSDPIFKATYLKEITRLFAFISDSIVRSIFIKKASTLFEVAEQILISEVNKIIRSGKHISHATEATVIEQEISALDAQLAEEPNQNKQSIRIQTLQDLEKEFIRYLILFGTFSFSFDLGEKPENKEENIIELTLAEMMVFEILNDEMHFTNPLYKKIFDLISEKVQEGNVPGETFYTSNSDNEISNLATNFIMGKDPLSKNWKEKFGVFIAEEKDLVKSFVIKNLNHYKLELVNLLIEKNSEGIKSAAEFEEAEILLRTQIKLTLAKQKYTHIYKPII